MASLQHDCRGGASLQLDCRGGADLQLHCRGGAGLQSKFILGHAWPDVSGPWYEGLLVLKYSVDFIITHSFKVLTGGILDGVHNTYQ